MKSPSRLARRRPGNRPKGSKSERQVFRRKRAPLRWKEGFSGVLIGSAGAGVVVGLLQLPERLDTLLLLSTALANVIRGVQLFLLGLLQVLAVVVLVAAAVGALVLVVAGLVRFVRAFLPRKTPPGLG
jgi:Mg2+/Co2+ transporter CorB